MIARLFALALMLSGTTAVAQTRPTVPDCGFPDSRDLRPCSDQRAAQFAQNRPIWQACSGQCFIRQDQDGAVILSPSGQIIHRLAGLEFLPGTGKTTCLTQLPFLSRKDELIVIESDHFQEISRLALADFYDIPPHQDPILLPAMTGTAQLSCDGARFFRPLQDTMGFAMHRLGPAGWLPDDSEAPPILILAPSGRYALSVDSKDEGLFRLEDLAQNTSFKTSARFELDLPFFDISETYLLIRREGNEGPSAIDIVSLASGEKLGTQSVIPESGLFQRVHRDPGGVSLTALDLGK